MEPVRETLANKTATAESFAAMLYRYWLQGHFRSAGNQILIVAVVLLICGMVMMGANVSSLQKHIQQVNRANAFMLHLSEVEKDSIGVEYSLRGLALTGQPQFRGYFVNRRENLRAHMRELDSLAATCVRRGPGVKKLDTLVEARIQVLQPYAFEPQIEPAAYAQLIVDPSVRQQRYEIEDLIHVLRQASLAILDEQQNYVQETIVKNDREGFIILTAAFLLAVFGVFLNRSAQRSKNT